MVLSQGSPAADIAEGTHGRQSNIGSFFMVEMCGSEPASISEHPTKPKAGSSSNRPRRDKATRDIALMASPPSLSCSLGVSPVM